MTTPALEETGWYRGDQKPDKPGVYKRMFPHRVMYALWTGVQWLLASKTPLAASKRTEPSAMQPDEDGVPWCGLTQAGYLAALARPRRKTHHNGRMH